MGRAPARSLKVLGVARRGKDQSKGPNPLRIKNSKALLYKKIYKDEVFLYKLHDVLCVPEWV